MDLYSLAEGPLLWISFLIFIVGSLTRCVLFLALSLKRDRVLYKYLNLKYVLITMARWLLPANRDVLKNPIFVPLAYIFHICLIIVPIWFAGHITLWEESRFEWSWNPIPDLLADWMTIALVVIGLFLLLRRILSPSVRYLSAFSDYFLLIVTIVPFLSGYFLTHGTVEDVPFLGENIQLIHMLSAEFMLILIPFTKLSHFILFFFSRGSTAIEFGRREYSV